MAESEAPSRTYVITVNLSMYLDEYRCNEDDMTAEKSGIDIRL